MTEFSDNGRLIFYIVKHRYVISSWFDKKPHHSSFLDQFQVRILPEDDTSVSFSSSLLATSSIISLSSLDLSPFRETNTFSALFIWITESLTVSRKSYKVHDPISGQHTTCRETTTTVHSLQFLEKNRMESYNQFLLVKISQIMCLFLFRSLQISTSCLLWQPQYKSILS